MKKKLLLFSLILSAGALLITGTLAYRTVTEEFESMIKMGNVQLKIHQTDSAGVDVSEEEFPVKPGDEIDRVVTVENTGAHSIFLRVKLTQNMEGRDDTTSRPSITYNINSEYWEKVEEYYYYKKELAKGEFTEPLFADNKVTIDGAATTIEELGKYFTLDVQAYGVQSKNNGENPLEAQGWPEEMRGDSK